MNLKASQEEGVEMEAKEEEEKKEVEAEKEEVAENAATILQL